MVVLRIVASDARPVQTEKWRLALFAGFLLGRHFRADSYPARRSSVYRLITLNEGSMKQRRNKRAEETGGPRENPPTNGIVPHDTLMRKLRRRRRSYYLKRKYFCCRKKGTLFYFAPFPSRTRWRTSERFQVLSYTEERCAALLARPSAFWWLLLATSSASHNLAPSIRLSAIPAISLTFPSRVFAFKCSSPARAKEGRAASGQAGAIVAAVIRPWGEVAGSNEALHAGRSVIGGNGELLHQVCVLACHTLSSQRAAISRSCCVFPASSDSHKRTVPLPPRLQGLTYSITGVKGRGETEDPRGNPPTRGIVRHDSLMPKFRSDPAGHITCIALMGGEQANRSDTMVLANKKNQLSDMCAVR
ncbi:hypothetical protein PR048_009548 [Dryococelus australis]|uniref:Uncharacterized protein n=1 Tax=Dryococelus australis TaxID=614101 RepID=A0ABQ9I076_9NEOP|nr:hypothetical protein PR048_009548 [Dryococelus australis]